MMQRLKMESVDITKKNIQKIAEFFPNVITETRDKDGRVTKAINFELLKQELSSELIDGEECYDFTWVGKKASIIEANRPIRKTLRPCVEESKDWETTGNLYIEGDNLDVLKLLQESYLNSIKMIYIDPPYNTGKDFIYKDSFTMDKDDYEEEIGLYDEDENRLFQNTDSNGRFHSDWCSMMYPRLKLARNLLSEDGVIFVSIDDNEVHNLRKICDEVFGEDNFVAQITVVGNPRGRDYGGVARMHDYILVFSKSDRTKLNLIEDKANKFSLFDDIGGFELRELRNRNIKFNINNRPNLYYPFYINETNIDENGLYEISLKRVDGWLELYPLESQGVKTVWRWGKQKSAENVNVNIKAKKMRNGSYQIVEKYREPRVMARSVWWDKETNTEKGTLLLKELFAVKCFDYPKPMEMIKRICEMSVDFDAGDIILDFFSGSATTAHAVMQLNAEDGGNRKFIMVQLPEPTDEKSEAYKAGYNNICEIGKERIRRAGDKINEEIKNEQLKIGEEEKKLVDIGFRVLKVDSTNMKDVYYAAEEYSQQTLMKHVSNIKDDRTDTDLLYGVLIDWGLPLSLSHKTEEIEGAKVHTVDEGSLIACFTENVSENVVREIARRQPLRAVFRDSSFRDSADKINIVEIFKLLAPNTSVKVI